MKFNIIGSGRLGKNLALSVLSTGCADLVAVCNRRYSSAIKAVAEIGAGVAVETLADLPAVDMTFITSPDDCIASIAARLNLSSGIVVHCSGVLSSDVLEPLRQQGCLIASIHPLRAFRENNIQANAFHACDCAVEGDAHAVDVLTTLFTEMGAQVVPISAAKKGAYHAAAVMASNYVVTLAGCAIELFIDAGLSETQAKGMAERMMQSSLTNLQETTHAADALTGPLARGDLNTIHRHLQAIKTPHIDALYRAAALATLPLTDLNDEAVHALKKCLHER